MVSAEELKKLPPEKRIELLKQIEEQKKKDIEKEIAEAEALIKESEKEEAELEKRIEVLQKIKVPEAEDKSALEKTVEKEKIETKAPVQYGQAVENTRINIYELASQNVYERIKDIRDRASQGQLTENDLRIVESYSNIMPTFDKAKTIMDDEARSVILKSEYALRQIQDYKQNKSAKTNNQVGY